MAIPSEACDEGLAGTRSGSLEPEDPTAANLLLPFRDLLSGDVLVVGRIAPALRIEAARTARSLTCVETLPTAATDARYDVIVAVDLLDTPSSFDGSAATRRSEVDALAHRIGMLRGCLRPDGQLILALANPRALRVGPDASTLDGTAEPALDRMTLRRILEETGLAHQHWWFPFPDHRVPLTLLSERGLSPESGLDAGALASASAGGHRAWRGAAEAGSLAAVAPGFVMAASARALPEDPRLALHLGPARRAEFNKVATILARADGACPSVRRVPRTSGLPRAVAGITNRFPDEDLAPGRPYSEALEDIFARDGWDASDFTSWGERWFAALRTDFLGDGSVDAQTVLPAHAFDAIPRNLLVARDRATFIDLEWETDAPLDLGHLIVRGGLDTLLTIGIDGMPAPGVDPTLLTLLRALTRHLGIPLDDAALGARLTREAHFQRVVSGRETGRDLAWLAHTPLIPRARLFARADALAREVASLRAQSRHGQAGLAESVAAEAEARLQTDRAIRYAAEREREVERLSEALARAEAERAAPRPRSHDARPGLARRLRRFLSIRT